MIACMSPSLLRAMLTSMSWCGLLILVALLVNRWLSVKFSMFLRAGPNLRTLITGLTPTCIIADALQTVHRMIPRIARSVIESFVVSIVVALYSIFHPACAISWMFLASFSAFVSSVCLLAVNQIKKQQVSNDATGTITGPSDAREEMSSTEFFGASFACTSLGLSLLYVGARFLPGEFSLLAGDLGAVLYMACFGVASCIAAVYTLLSHNFDNVLSAGLDMTYMELLSTVSAMGVIILLCVSCVNALNM